MTARPHILVIDDDLDLRESVIEALEELGYVARGAANGHEALHQLRGPGAPPCLILLDLMMPVMDGPAFRVHQLADPALASIPVVAISAFHDIETRIAGLGLAHLVKPIKLDQLLELAQRHCPPPATPGAGPAAG